MDRADLLDELADVVTDERILIAIAAVPRPAFVAPELRERAWEDVALPIAGGQTISQPRVVARMLELLALAPGDRVLDVGTGSGYHAALLRRLGGEVTTIERDPELSASAAATLRALGLTDVACLVGDGGAGVPGGGPYDAINVAAACPEVPPALLGQLADSGRLVAPVGPRGPDRPPDALDQRLVRIVRDGPRMRRETLEPVRFVPLVRAPAARDRGGRG